MKRKQLKPTESQLKIVFDARFIPTLYWWIHHGALIELNVEPIDNRLQYIRLHKPANEVSTRLRWLKPVRATTTLPRCIRKHMEKISELTSKIYEPFDRTSRKEVLDLIQVVQDRQREMSNLNILLTQMQQAYEYSVGHRAYKSCTYREWMVKAWHKLMVLHNQEQPKCETREHKSSLKFEYWY